MRREREVIKAERKSETERKGGKRRERKKESRLIREHFGTCFDHLVILKSGKLHMYKHLS